MSIIAVVNSRAEMGPMQSVLAALPEARVVSFDAVGRAPHDAMACAIMDFTVILAGAKLVILLGDRYETLAAALAATFLRIPIAHIHGGETTTGAFDDAFRHSITHMAALHFVATARAANRITQLLGRGEGELFREHYRGVHLVGAPGLDGVEPQSAKWDRKLILITYHSETRAEDYGVAGCRAMLAALSPLCPPITSPSFNEGYDIWFCGVNGDPGNAEIRAAIDAWMVDHQNARGKNIDHTAYISAMQHASLIIGNSSAAIIEAPWVGCPSVNIGYRQQGREMASSVYQTEPDEASITAAINAALSHPASDWAPVYRGGAAEKIAKVCKNFLSNTAG